MIPIASRALPALVLGLTVSLGLQANDGDLPPVQTQGEVSFVTGGIGSDESAALKAAAPGYALTLRFASATGTFLASVHVSIRDAAGQTVLDTVSEGPYLLAQLKPGRYRVSASVDGVERSLDLNLKAGAPQQHGMVWPARKADAEPKTSPAVAAAEVQAELPPKENQGGVPYLTGGIGSDESAAIKAQFPKYALALTFAGVKAGRNVFLASVPVQIRDASGATVLDVTTEGPYLLVDVPPGKYEIVATHAGKEQRASVQAVVGKSTERAFSWVSP